jgi:hypothetical protein
MLLLRWCQCTWFLDSSKRTLFEGVACMKSASLSNRIGLELLLRQWLLCREVEEGSVTRTRLEVLSASRAKLSPGVGAGVLRRVKRGSAAGGLEGLFRWIIVSDCSRPSSFSSSSRQSSLL